MNKICTALIGASMLVLAACGSNAAPASFEGRVTIDLTGRIDLLSSTGLGDQSTTADLTLDPQAGTCFGINDFADLSPGKQVTLADADGKTLAAAKVAKGTFDKDAQAGLTATCRFRVIFTDVPGGKKVYAFKVGDRPAQQLTQTKLENNELLTLGN